MSIITACAWLVCILVPLIIGETPNYALHEYHGRFVLASQILGGGGGGGGGLRWKGVGQVHAPMCSQHILLVSNHSDACVDR